MCPQLWSGNGLFPKPIWQCQACGSRGPELGLEGAGAQPPPPASARLRLTEANRGFCFHSAEGDLPLRRGGPKTPQQKEPRAGAQAAISAGGLPHGGPAKHRPSGSAGEGKSGRGVSAVAALGFEAPSPPPLRIGLNPGICVDLPQHRAACLETLSKHAT